jgi:hypothetical protein
MPGHDLNHRKTPELVELLALCARRQLDAQRSARLREIAADPRLAWEEVLAEAGRHKLLPLVAAHLRSAGAELPAEVAARLGSIELANAQVVLADTSELLALLERLRERGVEAVPYKGVVLSLQLYGSLSLRPAGDLDLVVRRADVPAAVECLRARGFAPTHTDDRGAWTFRLRHRYSMSFTRRDLAAELHWAFTNRDIAFDLELEEMAPRLGSVRIGAHDVPVFAPEDLLLILCVHGAKHRWDRLEWIGGVGEAVRAAHGLDWDRLVARSTGLGVRRMLLLGLLLGHDLVDAPVPARILALARADRRVVSLAAEVPGILAAPPIEAEAFSWPVDRFRYRLRERLRDRVRFLLYRVTTPSSPQEWKFINVGGRQIPVHGLTRPFRLAGKALSRAGGRGSRDVA